MSLFQMILLAFFGLLGVGGALYFALGASFGSSATQVGPVLIWGPLESAPFNAVIQRLAEDDDRLQQVAYERHDPDTFYADLAEAIASGRGPDLIVLSQEYLVANAGKTIPISYEYLPERTFEESFISEGRLFLVDAGVLGVPIAVDPLVTYYNRDLLASSGFAQPPRYWDELFGMAEKITRRDEARNITKSTIAFGEYENVTHAKNVLATLILQAGGRITAQDTQGRLVPALISRVQENVQQPAESALRFYTEFANPTKSVYTWNRSLPDARFAFAAGDTALYIGYASELPLIRAQNPNLNFSVAMLPQIRDIDRRLTFGQLYAFAVPNGSQNPAGARTVAFVLASGENSALLAEARGTPSPHLEALASQSSTQLSVADAVFLDSALIADGWLDPDPRATDQIFRAMIEDVTSGALRLGDAISDADKALLELVQ